MRRQPASSPVVDLRRRRRQLGQLIGECPERGDSLVCSGIGAGEIGLERFVVGLERLDVLAQGVH
jgi:hypothetical protein